MGWHHGDPQPPQLTLPSLEEDRTWEDNGIDRRVQETWPSSLVRSPLKLPGRLGIPSTFFTNAPEKNDRPHLKARTLNFSDCNTLFEIGLQILEVAGWRRDCVQNDMVNAARALRPGCDKRGAWTAVGPFGAMTWAHGAPKEIAK